jgi:hypothetical protein
MSAEKGYKINENKLEDPGFAPPTQAKNTLTITIANVAMTPRLGL